MAKAKFRMALLQLLNTADKQANIEKACQFISKAVDNGAQMVCLPEYFNGPCGTQYFSQYAETIPGPTTSALAEMAKKMKIFLVGGSIPENKKGKLYNTAFAFNPQGEIIMKYSKNHLYEVDIPDKLTFSESETVSPGNAIGTFITPYGKFGVGICYDLRFQNLANVYAQKEKCDFLLYPGAFNLISGPLHWELLQRARAVDNQVFVAGISLARDETAAYVAWGHTMVVDPWGKVLEQADHTEQTIIVDIDMEEVTKVRQQIGIGFHRRDDLYKVISLKEK